MLPKKSCHHYKTCKTYYLSCRRHTNNIGPRKVIMTNKIVRQTSKCANCVAKKLRFLKQ